MPEASLATANLQLCSFCSAFGEGNKGLRLFVRERVRDWLTLRWRAQRLYEQLAHI